MEREKIIEKLDKISWKKIYFYFKCNKCNYAIKKNSSVLLSDFFRCPLCKEPFAIERCSYEEYKKSTIRDKW
jgi:hypothetical protein